MTESDRKRLAKILQRPGMPAAGDHARLILEQADRRNGMRAARRNYPAPQPSNADATWLSVLGIALIFACFAAGWILTD